MDEISITEIIQAMEKTGNFKILPCDNFVSPDGNANFTKLKLNQTQKMQISALLQQVPLATAAGTLTNTYKVVVPEGIAGSLIKLKQGGYGTTLKGVDGRFAGSASIYPMWTEAAVLGAFSVMSVVTGQFFLTLINKELKMINTKLDLILNFLYEDKRAELMSQIDFMQYAYQNYGSIMAHSEQRIATVYGLQEARKLAVQDIDFYLSIMKTTIGTADGKIPIEDLVSKVFQMKESLDYSMQLYSMSSLLEVCYAQNYDLNYIKYIEEYSFDYIEKWEKRMLPPYNDLLKIIDGNKKKNPNKERQRNQVQEWINTLQNGESHLKKSIKRVLHSTRQETEYYLTKEGEIYMQAS